MLIPNKTSRRLQSKSTHATSQRADPCKEPVRNVNLVPSISSQEFFSLRSSLAVPTPPGQPQIIGVVEPTFGLSSGGSWEPTSEILTGSTRKPFFDLNPARPPHAPDGKYSLLMSRFSPARFRSNRKSRVKNARASPCVLSAGREEPPSQQCEGISGVCCFPRLAP